MSSWIADHDRADKAVNFLAETDVVVAMAKVEVLRCKKLVDRCFARLFVEAPGKNQKERESWVNNQEEYDESFEVYLNAMESYEKLKARRETAEMIWETWRSENSARKQGKVL